MSHPLFHAQSFVKRFGGLVEDYQPIHDWLDATKETFCDFRHRALRHHSQGAFEAERVFGVAICNSEGKLVPTRCIAELHIKEDCGESSCPDRTAISYSAGDLNESWIPGTTRRV